MNFEDPNKCIYCGQPKTDHAPDCPEVAPDEGTEVMAPSELPGIEVNVEKMTEDMSSYIEEIVESNEAYMSTFVLEDNLREYLLSLAADRAKTAGVEFSDEELDAIVESVGLRNESHFEKEQLVPEHLQGPEDGTNRGSLFVGDKKLFSVFSGGDFYGGRMDGDIDSAAVAEAMERFGSELAKRVAEKKE